MDQPALSFGEGHYESLTLFNTQLAPEELAKQTSIDKLEIPDEKIAAYLPENGFLTSSVLNIPNSLTLNNNQQIRHKSTGRLRGMLSNKENMPSKETEESSENKREPIRTFGENLPVKINQPFATQTFAKKPPVNASFQGLRSSGGFSESSFAQENKKQDQDRSFDHRLTFQPPSEKTHSRKQSLGNLKIEVENPNTTPVVAATEVMKDITSKQADQMNYPRSRSTKENENKDDKKPEAKPMRKRTPKKVEISLAFGTHTVKSEQQPQKQEEKTQPVVKVEQAEQRRSAWNSRDRLGDEEEPPFRALSRERVEPSTRSLSKASFTEQDVSIEKRESFPKKPAPLEEKQIRTEQAPIPRPVYGIKDEDSTEGKTPSAEEKTVYQRLFEMNKSRRGFHKGGSVPALNDSETYHDRTNSYSRNDSNFYMKNSFTFQPKLESKSRHMKRDEKVDSLLYKDAIRRQNKSLENICSQVPTPSSYTLHQSNKLMAKKFIREFEEEISSFFGIAQERKFDYAQLTEFLKAMKFVKGLQDLSTHAIHEKTLVDMIWSILKGDKYRGVNERNLLLFLLAIMGLHLDIPSYTPKTTANVTPNVSDKIVFPIQVPKIESNAPPERNPSEKRESMWKKRQEAELAEALTKNSAQEDEPEKEAVGLADVRSPSVNSNATAGHVKSRQSLKSDHTESLGISNIFAQKLSFQSEHAKQPESQALVEPEVNQVNQEDNLVGMFDNEENISFTEEEVQRISQTYEMFYSNRLYASKSLTKKISQSHLDASFEPEILEYSRQLAFNYREKQLQNLEEIIVDLKENVPGDRRVTNADLLYYRGLSTKNKLSQQRQKSLEKQLEECTFRPNLTASTRTPGRKTIKFDKEKEEPYQSRGEHLYSIAKKSEKAKIDRSTRATEQRKVYEKCTFKPDLDKSRRSQSRSKVKAQDVSKDFDKSVERMKRGREQREQVRMATENRAQKLDDKHSQFKFTLEKIHSRKDSLSSTKKEKLNTSNVESMYNKKAGYMSFVNGQRGDDSFASFDTRDNYQHVGAEPEEMIYQANLQNNHKILNESNYNQTLNKFLSQTYGNLTEDPTTHTLFQHKAAEKVPLLFIDVNFGGNKSERIAVYEGDTAEGLATHFAAQNNLNDHLKSKLTMLLQSHMSGILSKIDEEMPSTQSEIQRVPPIQGSQGAYNTHKFR